MYVFDKTHDAISINVGSKIFDLRCMAFEFMYTSNPIETNNGITID